jgi:hypothetical protein
MTLSVLGHYSLVSGHSKKHIARRKRANVILNFQTVPFHTAPPVGTFYVYMSNDYPSVGGYAIKFDTVSYDAGGEYSPATGIFVAPVSGTYVINYDIFSSGTMWVELMVGGVRKMDSDTTHSTFSGTAIVHANLYDDIYVQVHPNYGGRTLYGAGRNHFSGFLLYADSS